MTNAAQRLSVKVVPGASRTVIAGWLGDALKIRVAAPPEDGKANRAVVDVLANALNIPSTRIRIVSGTTSSRKVIELPAEIDIKRIPDAERKSPPANWRAELRDAANGNRPKA